ncbi:AraC family transcriptional regulator [Shinella sp. S4-D37]
MRRALSIEQAASMAGCSNAANFTTAFKKAFGYTPGVIVTRSKSN